MMCLAMWRALLSDRRGQDLIEYALMAGLAAVTAAVILPQLAAGISTVFLQVGLALARAALGSTYSTPIS